jgi:hypothetical protein
MRVSSSLLDDTLKLFQLARETARINGQPSQVERLTPLVDNLTTLVSKTQNPISARLPESGSSLMAQNDFKKLLDIIQTKSQNEASESYTREAFNQTDRNTIVVAMASGGMRTLDIARQMGMTIDEVQLILTINQFRPTDERMRR